MIIEINNKRYTNPDFTTKNGIALIRIDSDASFQEISADFLLDEGDMINQYDDSENQIGQWYVKGMCSIRMPGEDGAEKVEVKYYISQLGKDAREVIEGNVDENTDAVLELADYITTIEQTYDDYKDELDNQFDDFKSTVNSTINNLTQTINGISTQLTAMQAQMDSLNSSMGILRTHDESLNQRVTRLENAQ